MSVTNKNVVSVTESSSERGDGDATTISMTKVRRAAMPARKLLSLVVTLLAGFVPPAGRLDDPKPRLTKEVASRS
jgi:hypothetical protein